MFVFSYSTETFLDMTKALHSISYGTRKAAHSLSLTLSLSLSLSLSLTLSPSLSLSFSLSHPLSVSLSHYLTLSFPHSLSLTLSLSPHEECHEECQSLFPLIISVSHSPRQSVAVRGQRSSLWTAGCDWPAARRCRRPGMIAR